MGHGDRMGGSNGMVGHDGGMGVSNILIVWRLVYILIITFDLHIYKYILILIIK